jgi:hypothetical protein
MLINYPNNWTLDGIHIFANQNWLMPGIPVEYSGGPIMVMIDAALVICPAQQTVPDINVIPDSLFHSQQVETLVNYNDDFTIFNNGTAPLTYSLSNTLSWITITGWTGSVPAGGNEPIDISVNTSSIPVGVYFDSVTIVSNDPDTPVLNRPIIRIKVTPGVCSAMLGDANGDGKVNGMDVGYCVTYLKYDFPPPPIVCDCPPYGSIYAACDVNGNCAFNGMDVTAMVSHFKYEVPYVPCAACPWPEPIPTKYPKGNTAGPTR